jgi:hypothetical protein
VDAQEEEQPREVVKTTQTCDKFCQSLKTGPATSKSEYFTDDEGLIFRCRKNGKHQLFVPIHLANRVIKMNHDPVTVAQPGRSRTLDILSMRFYWPGMSRHVEKYVKNCHACQRLKPRHEFKAFLGDVSEPTWLWKVVAIVIYGPFPKTPNKNR